MRIVRYNVAASVDGFIADSDGQFDWIPNDPTVDFAALFARVDTVLIGARSFADVQRMGSEPWPAAARVYLFSRTLRPEDYPNVTVVAEDAVGVVQALREETGDGEIWLFGGSALFRSLLAGGQVDSVEVTLVPILLAGGVPLLPPGVDRTPLDLTGTRTYPSGMVTLSYRVRRAVDAAPVAELEGRSGS